MPDPHVEALYYKFVNENEGNSFEGVSPWKGTLGPFDVELRDGNLIAHPHDHHADRESARQVLEPYLRDWESAAFLKGRYRIKFHYDRADVMDRAPEPGSVTVYPE